MGPAAPVLMAATTGHSLYALALVAIDSQKLTRKGEGAERVEEVDGGVGSVDGVVDASTGGVFRSCRPTCSGAGRRGFRSAQGPAQDDAVR